MELEVTEIVKKQKSGLFNRKLRKAKKSFDNDIESVEKNSHLIKENTAKIKILYEMLDEINEGKINKLIEQLEYAAPSKSKDVESVDIKISNMLDDIKLAIVSKKSAEKIGNEIEELRILITQRNQTAGIGD